MEDQPIQNTHVDAGPSMPAIGNQPVTLKDGHQWYRTSPWVLLRIIAALFIGIGAVAKALLESGAAWRELHRLITSQAGVITSIVHVFGLGGLLVVVIVVVYVVIRVLIWRNTYYRIDQTTFHLLTGIIGKNHRRVPISRIQNVTVKQSLVQRILGYATLIIESAGSDSSHITVEYVRKDYAVTMHDVLTSAQETGRALGTDDQAIAGGMPSVVFDWERTPTAPGEAGHVPTDVNGSDHAEHTQPRQSPHHYEVTIKNLVASQVLDVTFIVAMSIIVVTIVGVTIGAIIAGISAHEIVAIIVSGMGGVIAVAILIATMIGAMVKSFADYYRFRAVADSSTIRISRGLLSTRNQTIPRHRIHALRIHQKILWRHRDLWQAQVLLAGTSSTDHDQQSTAGIIMPAGLSDELRTISSMVLHDFDVSRPDLYLGALTSQRQKTQPAQGQWVADVDNEDALPPCVAIAPQARWLHPWAKDTYGILVTRQCVIIRQGRWSTKVTVIPHSHIQSYSIRRGPLDAIMNVAKIDFHLVGLGTQNMTITRKMKHLPMDVVAQFVASEGDLIRDNWVDLKDSAEAKEAVTALAKPDTDDGSANAPSEHKPQLASSE